MKTRLNFVNVCIDTNLNKEGDIYNKLWVNFDTSEKDYYRIGEFLSFPEKKFLKQKYNYDFETIQMVDIVKNIQYVDLCKEESRYGSVKMFLHVHFDIGYDKKINIENDDYFLLYQMYKFVNNIHFDEKIKK